MQDLKKTARTLFDQGYEPIPVSGKIPIGKEWNEGIITIDTIETQDYSRATGIGLLCRDLVGIDVDIRSQEISDLMYRFIIEEFYDGVPPMIRIGDEPKFLIPIRYDADQDELRSSAAFIDPEGNKHQIELKKSGQYVVYGEYHRTEKYTDQAGKTRTRIVKTDKYYRWDGGEIIDVSRADLPLFDGFMITQIIDRFEELATAAGWVRKKDVDQGGKKQKVDRITTDPIGDLITRPDPPVGLAFMIDVLKALVPIAVGLSYQAWRDIGFILKIETRPEEYNQALEAWLQYSALDQEQYMEKDATYLFSTFRYDGEVAGDSLRLGTLLKRYPIELADLAARLHYVEDLEPAIVEAVAAIDVNNPGDIWSDITMTDVEVRDLQDQKIIYPGLVAERHILTVIAMPGAGKTAFFFYEVAPYLARTHKVFYMELDGNPDRYKQQYQAAEKAGFTVIAPSLHHGKSSNDVAVKFKALSESTADLSGQVYIVDTVKKIADMMQKASIKAIYSVCRQLTAKGATVILLGHANKKRDLTTGELIYEGTVDVLADSDELIFFEVVRGREPATITAITEVSKGAKMRMIGADPFSFTIDRGHVIERLDEVIPIVTGPGRKSIATLEEMKEGIIEAIEARGPMGKTELTTIVNSTTGGSRRAINSFITLQALRKNQGGYDMAWLELSIGPRGKNIISIKEPNAVPTGSHFKLFNINDKKTN